MKTKKIAFLVVFSLLTIGSFAQSKERKFGFEFSSGVSVATSKLAGTNLDPGFGFEGIFHYSFMTDLGIYGGWGWNKLSSDDTFAGNDICFEETGYVIGLQYNHPIGQSAAALYLRGGGLYNHIETENAAGEIIDDTKHGWGFQLAGGVDFDLGKNWSFTPGIKFNSLSRETEYEGISHQMNLNYLSLRLGILKRF